MPPTSFARPRLGARFTLLSASSICLAACSIVNHFDDLKADISGGAGAGGGGGTDGNGMTGGAGGAGPAGGSNNAGGNSPTGGAAGGDGMAGSTGGGGSAAAADGGADAGVPRLLVCNEVTNTRHKLDDYSSNPDPSQRTLADRFFVNSLISGNTVRIIVQPGGNAPSYLVYYGTDNFKQGPFAIPNVGRVLEVHRTSPTTTATFTVDDTDPAMGQRFMMHEYDDTMQDQKPIDVVQLTKGGALGTSGSIEGTFATASDGIVGIVSSYSNGGLYQAADGLFDTTTKAAIGLTNLFSNVDPNATRPSTSFRIAKQGIYAFFGEFGSVAGQTEYGINDFQLPKSRPIQDMPMVAGQAPYVLATTVNSAGKLNIAIAKVDSVSGALSLFTGQFDGTAAMSFTSDKFNLAKQAASLSEIPFGSVPGFLEDNLVFAGPTGATRTDLSVLAVDVLGHKRMEQKLWSTTGKISNAAISPRGTVGVIGGKYHVVWSETTTDVNGMNGYDTLWYGQIECL